MVILYILGVLVYCILPLPIQIPLLFFNTAIPDPIPFLDEVIMYGAVLKKCIRIASILEWIEENKEIVIVGIIIIIIILFILF